MATVGEAGLVQAAAGAAADVGATVPLPALSGDAVSVGKAAVAAGPQDVSHKLAINAMVETD